MQAEPTALRIEDPGIRALFSEGSRYQSWLDVEAALAQSQAELAQSQAELGIIPESAAAEISRKAQLSLLDMDAVRAGLVRTGHPLVPLVWELDRICEGNAGGFVHWRATTQNITQTGTPGPGVGRGRRRQRDRIRLSGQHPWSSAPIACHATGFGEGEKYLGYADVTTDDSGNAGFSESLGPVFTGEHITATATDDQNNTSEFSACVQAAFPANLPSTTGLGIIVAFGLLVVAFAWAHRMRRIAAAR